MTFAIIVDIYGYGEGIRCCRRIDMLVSCIIFESLFADCIDVFAWSTIFYVEGRALVVLVDCNFCNIVAIFIVQLEYEFVISSPVVELLVCDEARADFLEIVGVYECCGSFSCIRDSASCYVASYTIDSGGIAR